MTTIGVAGRKPDNRSRLLLLTAGALFSGTPRAREIRS
jgi:hypothetical protein